MTNHCHPHTHNRRILWIVLALNFSMFGLEIWQGLLANATSLIADSMDFLSDSFSYALTLYVLTHPLRTRAKASLLKAWLMLAIGAVALWQGIDHFLAGAIPSYFTMGWVALLALAVNLTSATLLYSSREQDSNMRSVWLCSRNDAIANILILIAAGFVFMTNTLWPDLIAAAFIAGIETRAALQIMRQARGELRAN